MNTSRSRLEYQLRKQRVGPAELAVGPAADRGCYAFMRIAVFLLRTVDFAVNLAVLGGADEGGFELQAVQRIGWVPSRGRWRAVRPLLACAAVSSDDARFRDRWSC